MKKSTILFSTEPLETLENKGKGMQVFLKRAKEYIN